MTRAEHKDGKGTEKSTVMEDSTAVAPSGTEKPETHYDPIIFRDWCKACGICAAFCPKQVIGLRSDGKPVIERPDDCIGCRFCELHCPDFAISVKERRADTERQPS